MSSSAADKSNILWTISVFILIVGGVWAFNIFNAPTSSPEQEEVQTVVRSGDSFDNPIAVDESALAMSGQEFADRYKDKWVSFDGTIGSTTKSQGLRTSVAVGDDPVATFSDGSIAFIKASKSTFDSSLQQYAYEYTPEKIQDVRVVARVDRFSNFNIHLVSFAEKPSVTSR